MSSPERKMRLDPPRVQRACLLIGGIAALGCLIGALVTPGEFFRAYLWAWLGWLGIPLGCLMILMVYQLTGGHWGRAVQVPMTAAIGTLPLFAVLFIGVGLGIRYIYIWTDAAYVATDPVLWRKTSYLNIPRFLISAAVFFVTWLVLAWSFVRLRTRWVTNNDEKSGLAAVRVSAAGLVLMGLTVTFATIDWIMTLEPYWYSSIFGMMIGSTMILPAFAMATLVTAKWNSPKRTKAPETFNDLGNLLLALVMISAYMLFSQYFLIWSGNLPEEISWYLRRSHGIWQWVALAVVVFYVVLPFIMLLGSGVKSRPRQLSMVAAMIVVMHFVYQYWLVKPAFVKHDATHPPFFAAMHWLDLLTFLAIGGLWTALFCNRLQRLEGSDPAPKQKESQHAD